MILHLIRDRRCAIRRGVVVLSAVLAASVGAMPASAHFMWAVRESNPRHAIRLSFSEQPDEATSADLLARLGTARAWDAKGRAIALESATDSISGSIAADATVVAASKTWGVVDRSGDGSGAFFLEYYAKAAAHLEDAAVTLKLPIEVFASREGTQLLTTVQHGEARLAGASLQFTLPSGRTVDRVTDDSGQGRIELEDGGRYAVRARWIENRSGSADGKSYGEVRHYSTLTFDVSKSDAPIAAKAETSPAREERETAHTQGSASPSDATADPEAYALLKAAHDSRQVMPADFAGFTCSLSLREGDRLWEGTLHYERKGETEVRLEGADEEMLGWARRQIQNVIGHRRGGDFAQGDGRYPLQLAADDHNPFGRLIEVNDSTDSSYRVRDDKVLEVTRTMEGSRFTITVIETMEADAGKYLANHFLVSYRDPSTSALQKLEGYRDSYVHMDGVWLPSSRTVVTVDGATSPSIRMLRFKSPKRLVNPVPASATRD